MANIAKTFHDCHLEVVLVGNAAAALQGAPVTTLDFDFMKRRWMKKKKPKTRKAALAALRKESDRAEREQIRLLLSLPMNRRTHFLRVRLPSGGSAL